MERTFRVEEAPQPVGQSPEPPAQGPAGLAGELPRVRAFLARLLGRGGRAADADDLSQEVALRALRYGGSFDPGRPLGPWLRRAAVRAWIDEAERAQRRPASLDAGDPAGGLHGDRVAQREELALLLAALTEREREVLVRFHAGGESIAGIAASLAVPEGTIKSHLHRARKKLVQRAEEADE